jgi:putative hemolysin
MSDTVGLTLLILLIVLNGIFVAAEYSLVSIRRTRIDQLVEEGNARAKLVQKAVNNIGFYIAATQLGITVASIATGIVAEPALGRLFEGPLLSLGVAEGSIITIATIISLLISSFIAVIFAELVPKSLAIQRAESLAMFLIIPLMGFAWVFGPLSRMLAWMGGGIVGLFGIKAVAGHHTAHSEEEIRMIVNASSQQGVLENDEKELVYKVFDLTDTTLRRVMTPRPKMIAIEADATLKELLELDSDHNYSRLPVYEDNTDHIVGVVKISEVLKHLNELEHVKVRDIVHETYFAPETMRVPELLRKLKEKKMHMAIVVDEFDGTAGVVTLEDLLEELVGEIYDESDEPEEVLIKRLEDGVMVLEASIKIDQVEHALGIDVGEELEGEFDTLSGFIYHQFGYIPQQGEETDFEGWIFQIEEADERRILKVRVTKKVDENQPPELDKHQQASSEGAAH